MYSLADCTQHGSKRCQLQCNSCECPTDFFIAHLRGTKITLHSLLVATPGVVRAQPIRPCMVALIYLSLKFVGSKMNLGLEHKEQGFYSQCY